MSTTVSAPGLVVTLLCASALATGCKGDSPLPSDGPTIREAGREAAASDARRDARLADRGPDQPRTPARWELVSGGASFGVIDHSMTLLVSGDVLVVGGWRQVASADTTLDEVHRYQASANVFVPAAKLAQARARHTATRLADGRVFVVGGQAADWLASTEFFDPGTGTWSAGPPLPSPRLDHTATLLPSGQLLVTGGSTGTSLNTMAVFDPQLGAWKVTAPTMKQGRTLHTATLVGNGKVLLAGGVNINSSTGKNVYLDTLELFDPATGQSNLLTSKLSRARGGHTATLLSGGKILFVGGMCGAQCPTTGVAPDDLYDPPTDTVVGITHFGLPPVAHSAELLLDGRALIFAESATPGQVVAYVPGLQTWETLPPMKVDRYGAASARLLDGSVLVVGGVENRADGKLIFATPAERFFP